jgi:RNA polymerase sigma-70 factor (ECF subfamily)
MQMARKADARLDAIEAVYRERFSHFVRVATAITGDQHAAVEAVQQAFADLIRGRRRFRGDGPLEAWVWRTVVRSAQRRAGERRRAPVALDAELVVAPNGDANETAALRATVALLPERQRLAVFLRYYAGLDYREIADVLGVTVGTISASLHAAHTSLRQTLESEEVPT